MKKQRYSIKTFCLLFSLSVIFINCNKNNDESVGLKITSLSPAHGGQGTVVTINGRDFSNTASENHVSFNGMTAEVMSADASSLKVMVPSLAGTGTVTVTMNGKSAASDYVFTYDTLYTSATFAAGLSNPQYIAVDANQNLYVTNFGSAYVSKISKEGNISTFATGINGTTGIAIGADGNIYVVSNDNTYMCKILRINSSGTKDTVAVVAGYVYGLCIDNNNNLYAANAGRGAIDKITATGVVSEYVTDLGSLTGIAVDKTGNVYAATFTNGVVLKITSSGQSSQIYRSILSRPQGIAIDDNQNLFIAFEGTNTVVKFTASGVINSSFTQGFDLPDGVAADTKGNIYVVNSGSGGITNGSVTKLTVQ